MKLRLAISLTLCAAAAPVLVTTAAINPSSRRTQESKQSARPSPAATPGDAPAQKRSPAAKPTPVPAFTDPQKLDAVELLVKEIGRTKFYRRPSHAARVLKEKPKARAAEGADELPEAKG